MRFPGEFGEKIFSTLDAYGSSSAGVMKILGFAAEIAFDVSCGLNNDFVVIGQDEFKGGMVRDFEFLSVFHWYDDAAQVVDSAYNSSQVMAPFLIVGRSGVGV
jgi:hypothetical protein